MALRISLKTGSILQSVINCRCTALHRCTKRLYVSTAVGGCVCVWCCNNGVSLAGVYQSRIAKIFTQCTKASAAIFAVEIFVQFAIERIQLESCN